MKTLNHARCEPAPAEPLHPAPTVPAGPANSEAIQALKCNILIVDDRPDKLLALEAVLASLGQNLVLARSGKEALRWLLKQDFAVILLDVSMPGMDGFETASLIRQRLNTEHTPIIFVTSVGDTATHMSRGYSLGAVDYLLTPIQPEVLRTKVSVLVELHRKTELIKLQAERLRRAEDHRHQRQLAEISDRLEIETRRNRFFTLAVDLLAICDFKGLLLQANASWQRSLGYHPEQLIKRPVATLLYPEERAEFIQKINTLLTSPVPIASENRFLHQDGGWRWLGWNAVAFPEENLIYFFAHDITSRKSAEAQVHVLNRELEQRVMDLTVVNRELEAFNYSIAHDLRAPLRSMSGFAQALLEDEAANLSAPGMEYARRIARSARFMDVLLLDLLSYSSLGRADMPRLDASLDEIVAELLGILEKDISDLGCTVEVASPLGNVHVHPPTLKQIITNLISNSLKFMAPSRPPALRIHATRSRDRVRLWIEDNGIGIAAEHHEKIFGLFHRLHDTHAYPGTGIGLALVRKGAERMGGAAGVESEPGQGSRFWVDLLSAGERTNGPNPPTLTPWLPWPGSSTNTG